MAEIGDLTAQLGHLTMERNGEVPRRTSLAPLASPCFMLSLLGLEAEGQKAADMWKKDVWDFQAFSKT